MSIHSEIKRLRQAKGWSQQKLADEVSRMEGAAKPLAWQTVQMWEKEDAEGGTAPKRMRLANVATLLGTTVEALMSGDRQSGDTTSGVAHSVSLETIETVPTMTWEQIGMMERGAYPASFRIQVNDSSMEPRVRSGAWVIFDSRLKPKPGDGVLVRDSAGTVHFRSYKAGRPGVWEAHAENPDYSALESARDGLEVIAVLTAVEGRWS